VFLSGGDPVRAGIVPSLSQPGGNITGVTWFAVDLVTKHLALLHQLAPNARVVAIFLDDNFPDAVSQLRVGEKAPHALGLGLSVLHVRTASDIDTAFAGLVQQQVQAVVVGGGAFLKVTISILSFALATEITSDYPSWLLSS